jgi:hypothetical protein
MVATACTLIAASALLWATTPSRGPFPGNDPRFEVPAALAKSYLVEISALQRVMSVRRVNLDSTVAAAFDDNLRIIDEAIGQSEEALTQLPESEVLLDRYRSALDAKVAVLTAALRTNDLR